MSLHDALEGIDDGHPTYGEDTGEDEPTGPPPLCLYIAGPMRGKPDFNYPAFNDAARYLREDGWGVSNPAEHFGGDQSLPVPVYLREAARSLSECDGIVFLHGWWESEGAIMEYAIAQACGLHMFTLTFTGRPDWPEGHGVRLKPLNTKPPVELNPALLFMLRGDR
jgi:hypothetical protein